MNKLLLSLCAASLFTLGGCWNSQQGEKIGYIVKAGEHGAFSWCMSYEGELIRGGLNQGGGAFGVEPFDFTVEYPELITKLNTALLEQKEIIIKYHKEMFTFCRSETNYFVDSIEFK